MRPWIRCTAALLLALVLPFTARADDTAAQIRQHAGQHRLLVLGEYHGTRETPRLVQALMQAYAAEGAPVQLALELPAAENPVLSAYLASNGDAEARKALRGSPYWNTTTHLHDGRRSEDMLDLIEAARVLRTQGGDAQVFGFDRIVPAEQAGSGARDVLMAQELRTRVAALPAGARMIVLTGNVHGMRTLPPFLAYPPMTAMLKDLDLYNVRIEARTGESWACMQHRRCGTRALVEYSGPSPRLNDAPDRDYDMWIFAPRFTVARLLDAASTW